VIFRIPQSLAPDTYTLYLFADAEDCTPIATTAELEVLAKSEYVLSIVVAEQVQAGSSANVTVSVTEGGEPVTGINVTVTIVIELDGGDYQVIVESVISNNDGLLLVLLDIPNNTSELEVSARFQGSISEWPAETSVILVDVTPAATGTGAPINVDPVTIGIVVGGISIPILALVFRRKRRGSGRVTSAVSTAPSQSVPQLPPSASGMLQNVMDEIRNSEDGITRAELSRRLGPSASKIGAMVKDLLGTELGFYEVRDGAKKLIKFKDE